MDLSCGLCGFPTLGDFAVRISGDHGAVMHTISCGPILPGMQPVAEPTHERLSDGTVRRLATHETFAP